ncbi:hypothetical protein J6590_083912 [Homalodisca vitripennis]|nr:hypothetical protein J6590_083912 [Homalodisca vitripennis]
MNGHDRWSLVIRNSPGLVYRLLRIHLTHSKTVIAGYERSRQVVARNQDSPGLVYRLLRVRIA